MNNFIPLLLKLLIFLTTFLVSGCSFLVSSASEDFARNLKSAILNHNEPETVAQAIPAYLLMQEALISQQPENIKLLIATASLYRSYSSLIDEQQNKRLEALSTKALDLSLKAACLQKTSFCNLQQRPFPEFENLIKQSDKEDVPTLFNLGASWATWIQNNKSDWNALAQLAQVKALMKQILSLDENYQHGAAHLYLGVLTSLLPPAMGGEPDIAKIHFEKAIKLSAGKNLMIKVLYAKQYARLLFDRELHDRLLTEVLNAEVEQQGWTLINITAQKQAKLLLESGKEYF